MGSSSNLCRRDVYHQEKRTAFPNAAQRCFGIAIEQVSSFFFVIGEQGAGEIINIRSRKVKSFCACGRDDVRGIACQQEPTKAHGFSDKTMQRRDAHFETGTRCNGISGIRRKAAAQFIPKSIVAPIIDFIVRYYIAHSSDCGCGNAYCTTQSLVHGWHRAVHP